jgi:hypothetical protein
MTLLNTEWLELVAREGTVGEACEIPGEAVAEDGYPPCPACGCTEAPKDGECADCGLFLG